MFFFQEQLKDIFIKNGFPDECFKMWNMHFEQNDVQSNLLLELLPGILTMGFYPNVCYFKNRQKVCFLSLSYFKLLHQKN